MVSSEATQAVYIVDVYGLRPFQSGQLSRDVTKCVTVVKGCNQVCHTDDKIELTACLLQVG
jgi:hypothetical protein